MDDILQIGNNVSVLQSVKFWLAKNFSMKDLGEATYILGIKIYKDRSKRLLGLSQSTYIDKMLKRFSMEQSKRGYVPMVSGITLSKFCVRRHNMRGPHEYDTICFGYRIDYVSYVMY